MNTDALGNHRDAQNRVLCRVCAEPFAEHSPPWDCADRLRRQRDVALERVPTLERALCAMVGANTVEPAEFWRSLTPTQAIALLDNAPDVARAWAPDRNDDGNDDAASWIRMNIDGTIACRAGEHYDKPGTFYAYEQYGGWETKDEPSLDAAKAAVDAALQRKGWILG